MKSLQSLTDLDNLKTQTRNLLDRGVATIYHTLCLKILQKRLRNFRVGAVKWLLKLKALDCKHFRV